MKAGLLNDLADFLEERLSKALFALRKGNEEYRNLTNEYEILLKTESQDIEVYRQAITKISEVGKKISDIEKHYLFIVGMREKASIDEAISSEAFEKLFTDTK